MNASTASAQDERTALVLRLLAAVGHGDAQAVTALLTDDYVLVEPASLPWGGEHHGPAGYLEAIGQITQRFELAFDVHNLVAVDHDLVVLRSDVTFAARTGSRHTLVLPTSEWFTLRGPQIARSEVHLSDTAALLRLVFS